MSVTGINIAHLSSSWCLFLKFATNAKVMTCAGTLLGYLDGVTVILQMPWGTMKGKEAFGLWVLFCLMNKAAGEPIQLLHHPCLLVSPLKQRQISLAFSS